MRMGRRDGRRLILTRGKEEKSRREKQEKKHIPRLYSGSGTPVSAAGAVAGMMAAIAVMVEGGIFLIALI